ncbi:MAG TPA: hypothetical protein PLE45_01515 [Spirochaetota bacterium]|nr:hypothetical protein [Spirochaetota bacterium]HOL56640.1 hypothetical protein [Spirochaetota bacterium]HPP03730.1 hypothetical protein [Spirochaetota bacterium]
MVKVKKNFLITGNDNLSIDIFVSNFAYNKKLYKEDVLIINDSQFNIFTKIKKGKSDDDKVLKIFDLYTDKFIPCIEISQLIKEIQDKQKKKLLVEFSEKLNDIIIVSDFEGIYNDLYNELENIIVVLNNEPDLINQFYKLVKKINNLGFKKDLEIIIANVKFLEDAISIFNNLKKEINGLLYLEKEINFLGFLNIDMQKLYISLKRGDIYIKVFNEDSFHGCIKLIDDKLKENTKVLKEDSFLLKIIEKF